MLQRFFQYHIADESIFFLSKVAFFAILVFESFYLSEDTFEENSNIVIHKILLHKYTNVSLQDASIDFLQLIRRFQISKTNANELLSFIKRLLPCPNTASSKMNHLLNHLNMFNYFTRKICILCRKGLQRYQTKCDDCLMADDKHVAHIPDTDISSLLTCVVSLKIIISYIICCSESGLTSRRFIFFVTLMSIY